MNPTREWTNGVRKYVDSGGLRLSYLDCGEGGRNILLLLHGHMGDARTFANLVDQIAGGTEEGEWRIIGLDQRGHGFSDHPPDRDYSRDSYLRDILQLIEGELGKRPVTILGHSLGGANAYQFAARYPELVRAIIVEDVGAEIGTDLNFAAGLPAQAASLDELREALVAAGVRNVGYFLESVAGDGEGWRFCADLKGMPVSCKHLNGDWWSDWLASSCPALLIRGENSFVLDAGQASLMAARRPNTQLKVLPGCGHGVHTDDPAAFARIVLEFLRLVAI